MTTKAGISTTGYGPVRTIEGEDYRVRYEGLNHWKGSPKQLDHWSLWFDPGNGQWLPDSRVYLTEGSTLADAEKALFGCEEVFPPVPTDQGFRPPCARTGRAGEGGGPVAPR